MSTTFAKAGKKVDERIADFKHKVREVVDGVDDAIKSADRIGYERGIAMASNEARRGDNGHDPSEKIAEAIRRIPYIAP
jgi:hypothetical protein